MVTQSVAKKDKSFHERLAEGKEIERQAAVLAKRYGWSSQFLGPNPLSANPYPERPEVITPDGSADIVTPDILFTYNQDNHHCQFMAEVKVKKLFVGGDNGFFYLDRRRFDYACNYEGTTGIPIYYVFYSDDEDWLCCSLFKIRMHKAELKKTQPKGTEEAYKLPAQLFKHFRELLSLKNIYDRPSTFCRFTDAGVSVL